MAARWTDDGLASTTDQHLTDPANDAMREILREATTTTFRDAAIGLVAGTVAAVVGAVVTFASVVLDAIISAVEQGSLTRYVPDQTGRAV